MPPLQSHKLRLGAVRVALPGTSTQRPEPAPTIVTFDGPGGGLLGGWLLAGGGLDGGLSPNEEMNRHASPLVHVRTPSSQPEQPSTGPGP